LKEEYTFKPGFQFENIFSGPFFSIKTKEALFFYDYETQTFIRKIDDISPINVIWSDDKKFVSLICEEVTYVLQCNEKDIEDYIEKVVNSNEEAEEDFEDGCESAFEVYLEIKENIVSGLWYENVFIYLNNKNKLNYTIKDQIFSITTLNGNYYLLGFYTNSNRLYFMSKTFQLISYYFPISFINYQSNILKEDYDTAEKVSFFVHNFHIIRIIPKFL